MPAFIAGALAASDAVSKLNHAPPRRLERDGLDLPLFRLDSPTRAKAVQRWARCLRRDDIPCERPRNPASTVFEESPWSRILSRPKRASWKSREPMRQLAIQNAIESHFLITNLDI